MEWLGEALLPYWQQAKRSRRRTKIIVLTGGLLLIAEGRHRAVTRSATAVWQGLADIIAGYYEEKNKLSGQETDVGEVQAERAEENEAKDKGDMGKGDSVAHATQENIYENAIQPNDVPREALVPIEENENLSTSDSDSDESMQTARSSLPSSRQSSMASLDLPPGGQTQLLEQKEPHPAVAIATEYRMRQAHVDTIPRPPLELKPQESVKPPSPLVLRALLAAQGEDAFNFLEDLKVDFSDDDLPFG